jgi:hypothetical protein
MSLLAPTPPPYDPLVWAKLPFAERARLVCETWARQGYGTPIGVYFVYAIKVALYIAGWVLFCSMSPSLGSFGTLTTWWLAPLAFQKAVLWSMLFEGVGLGCGSGPLTGRYYPPFGGALYFLRPGTTKLPPFPKLPLLGGIRRSLLDVALYAALLLSIVRALLSPTLEPSFFFPILLLVALVALTDRTIFLALRAEHYAMATLCFAFAGNWIAGAKAIQLALWFWAGVSKLNHHFPAVVCVMTSNSPVSRWGWIRRPMYRNLPRETGGKDLDLRPSMLPTVMGHIGTVLELGIPVILGLSHGGTSLIVGLVAMIALHSYITSNVPMGVPIEWNVMVLYSGFALFWAHPEVSVLDLGSIPVAIALMTSLIVLPVIGNVAPGSLSFLLSMRYYAGNWAYSVWLFRGEAHEKLKKLTTSAPWVYEQLDHFYDRKTSVGLVGMVMGFRLMHLHGRALSILVPKAVGAARFEDYQWVDGEMMAGLALGWNFGDGHLHREPLLEAIQAQCGFEEGELRCMFVESQPLFGSTMGYRVVDAKTGVVERGEIEVEKLRAIQPWGAS